MTDTGLDVVTGAFSYTGSYIAPLLIASGRRVRTLTNRADRGSGPVNGIEVARYCFDDPDELARSLEGADVLYNTYWVRFPHRGSGFQQAVANSTKLFRAARRAGVRRVVHVSIANASSVSSLPYFRGKGLVEEALADSVDSYAIVRPTVVFGPRDVLVNNIGWLLRKFPVFVIAKPGTYRVRPVFVGDVAKVCVEVASTEANVTVDAVGPEILTFTEMVEVIRESVGRPTRLIQLSPGVVRGLAKLLGIVVRDTLLTEEELDGLTAGLVATEGQATGSVAFTEWVRDRGSEIGRRYASDLQRHLDNPALATPGARS